MSECLTRHVIPSCFVPNDSSLEEIPLNKLITVGKDVNGNTANNYIYFRADDPTMQPVTSTDLGTGNIEDRECTQKYVECRESQEWSYGLDNTGTSFNWASAKYKITLSDGREVFFEQTASTNWSNQLIQWANNLQQSADDAGLEWFVEPRFLTSTNLTGGGGGLNGAPTETIGQALYDGGMRWRYVNIQICPANATPVKAEVIEVNGNPYSRELTTAGAVLGVKNKYKVCVSCGVENDEWYILDKSTGEYSLATGGQIPSCYEPCGVLGLLPSPPEQECQFVWSEGCDNNNSNNNNDYTNDITRRATVCAGEQINVIFFQPDPTDNTALIEYTLVGDFVDCATGEIIEEPPVDTVFIDCDDTEVAEEYDNNVRIVGSKNPIPVYIKEDCSVKCKQKGCETSCYEKEVATENGIVIDHDANNIIAPFENDGVAMISTSNPLEFWVGFPGAGTLLGSVTVAVGDTEATLSAKIDTALGVSGSTFTFNTPTNYTLTTPSDLGIDNISLIGGLLLSLSTATSTETIEGTACMWYACDASGNPDPATVEWRDSKTLELVDVNNLTECEGVITVAIACINGDMTEITYNNGVEQSRRVLGECSPDDQFEQVNVCRNGTDHILTFRIEADGTQTEISAVDTGETCDSTFIQKTTYQWCNNGVLTINDANWDQNGTFISEVNFVAPNADSCLSNIQTQIVEECRNGTIHLVLYSVNLDDLPAGKTELSATDTLQACNQELLYIQDCWEEDVNTDNTKKIVTVYENNTFPLVVVGYLEEDRVTVADITGWTKTKACNCKQ